MSKKHNQRTVLILVLLVGLSAIAGLLLYALNQNINLFYTPTQVESSKKTLKPHAVIRVGGMVVPHSLVRQGDLQVAFDITDFEHHLTVRYQGILPDLFREGQGIVAKGKLNADGSFMASEVLAKHDEKYMPPEIKHLQERQS